MTLSKSYPGGVPFKFTDMYDFRQRMPKLALGDSKMMTSKGDAILLLDCTDDDDYARIIDLYMRISNVVVILVSSKEGEWSSLTQNQSRKRALEYVKRVPGNTPIIIVYSRVDLLGKDDEDPTTTTDGDCFDDSRIVARIKVSSKTTTGISELKEAIEKAIYRKRSQKRIHSVQSDDQSMHSTLRSDRQCDGFET